MKKTLFILSLLTLSIIGNSQGKLATKTAKITFHSETPIEKIEATTNQAAAILNKKTGEIAFKALIKSFEFEKALMQEHFNENYMESETYPKAMFKGKIEDLSAVNFDQPGNYDATVKGSLTIHGETKPITVSAKIKVKEDKKNIDVSSNFKVKLEDYNIKNDKIKNIASDIDVNVNGSLTELQKK